MSTDPNELAQIVRELNRERKVDISVYKAIRYCMEGGLGC